MDPALRKAADKGNLISLQELVAAKPNILDSTTRVEKNTALHLAASEGHILFVHHLLLQIGMNMEMMVIQNIDGDTPLHLAVRAGHLEVVEHLIHYSAWARGIDANLQEPTIVVNGKGNTPMHDALFQRKLDIALKLLEVNPRCAHELNGEMQSPFYIAVKEGLLCVVKKIADQMSTAPVSITGTSMTALHQAVLDDSISTLKVLLNDFVELVELTDSSGNNALHYAAWHNRVPMVSMLLKENSSLAFKKNIEHRTPLHMVAKYGSVQAATELLKQCPDTIKVVDLDGRNAFHIAIINNKFSVFELLLKSELPEEILNKQDNDGNTPLHHAAMLHQSRSILWLLLDDPRINSYVINKEGHTAWAYQEPLMIQSKEGNTLLHEAVIHDRNGDWDTPLHLAAKAGNSVFVDKLIRCAKVMNLELTTQYAKGPLIMKNKLGNTPLHNAVLHRKTDIALKLLEANPSCGHMLNAEMKSPLYIAVRDGLTYVVKKIAKQGLYVAPMLTHGSALHQSVLGNNIRALEILLDRYEELVKLTDLSGNNVLHYAAQHNNARIVSILLNKNCMLAYQRNEQQHTPLHMAAYYGSAEAAKELLKQFPDAIEMVDNMGQNALHIAATNDKVDVLELLLKYVLPEEIVNQQDREGNTPLHHAAKLSRRQSTMMLLNDQRVKPCLVNQDGDTAFALFCRAGISEMNVDEMNLWKELKKHESRRCKTKQRFRLRWYWRRSPYTDEIINDRVVVATFMSMATFGATLTMPGGYSQQSGTAIVGHHQAFKIFVVSNSISMCVSAVVVLCYFLSWKGCAKLKLSMMVWANMLIVLSGLMMIMSMLTALYLTIEPVSRFVAYVAISIGTITPFLACLILRKSLTRKALFSWWIGVKLREERDEMAPVSSMPG
ncbi:hypothetical protein ACQ4PT_066102 [Festuca glaucescens]